MRYRPIDAAQSSITCIGGIGRQNATTWIEIDRCGVVGFCVALLFMTAYVILINSGPYYHIRIFLQLPSMMSSITADITSGSWLNQPL